MLDLGLGAPARSSVLGPAVLQLAESTVLVPEGWRGATDATGTLILERER